MRFTLLPLPFLLVAVLSGCECSGPNPGTGDGGPREDARVPAEDAMADGDVDGAPSDAGPVDGGPMCVGVTCDPGERCEIVAGAPACVPSTCEELACAATERCVPAPVGMGNICVDNTCTDSLECAAEEHCDGTICVADVCVPGASACDGDVVRACSDDGSGSPPVFTCGSDAYFESMCTVDAIGATCPCEDDWDCPAFSRCEVGRCEGTGVAPTCSLPATPFTSVLPTQEIQWGGISSASRNAVGSALPSSSQVSMTPLVVNLDDDTGDGRIDELDIPEIVFLTYCGTDVTTNGTLRAIHGGGAARGADFFASVGSTTWHEGELIPTLACANGILNSTGNLAAGDLDGDGVPEIIAPTENAGLAIFSNTGVLLAQSAATQWSGYTNPSVAIANVDGAGLVDIVVGRHVFTLERPAGGAFAFVDRFSGALMSGNQGQGPISVVANLVGDSRLEISGGTTVYRVPAPPPGVTRRSGCVGTYADPEHTAFCAGQLLVAWDGQTVNGATMIPAANRDGFSAVADVLGADRAAAPGPANPLDGAPEVIVVADGRLLILGGDDGVLYRNINLGAGLDGGAPNVDDFDGDGFPEIGTAFGTAYITVDLQPPTAACPAWPNTFNDAMTGLQGNPARTVPATACTTDADCGSSELACNEAVGQCVCLHNGWRRLTEDNSSRVTGSTVFDFNGDGAAEIVYNDECFFRVYDGVTGAVLFRVANSSRTRTENPVVADVDNDGGAEIVFSANNDASTCSVGATNNGIEVWGDASDTWVSARRIWNQHAYHVTNVLESGAIPAREPESWLPYGGRLYNTYRSQPRSFGVAPDLTVARVQVSSPDAACGTLGSTLDIGARIENRGDLRVGADVVVTFHGEWPGGVMEPLYADAAMTPLVATLGTTLEPGRSVTVSAFYDAANNSPGTLPDRVVVRVDEASAERECVEDNNSLAIDVDAGSATADLAIDLVGALGGTCPARTVMTTVRNLGSAPASDILVRYYAGDPAAGGLVIHEETVAGPLAPGAEITFAATIDPFPAASVLVYAAVDPDDSITECNDANNGDAADERADCITIF